jgi:hypothetical protein
VVVGSVRALLQKLGPNATTFEPIIVRPGAELDADELLKQLVSGGYRREELVEHRGEIARRGSIIDIFPSTSNTPVRIDLWGDEVDRLTSFNVNDQRSTDPLSEAVIFAARELQLDDEVMDRARSLVATESWGREHWDRLADGGNFDGMESWLPWLIEKDLLLTDVLQDDCELLLVEPRRMRDRAHDLGRERAGIGRIVEGDIVDRDPARAQLGPGLGGPFSPEPSYSFSSSSFAPAAAHNPAGMSSSSSSSSSTSSSSSSSSGRRSQAPGLPFDAFFDDADAGNLLPSALSEPSMWRATPEPAKKPARVRPAAAFVLVVCVVSVVCVVVAAALLAPDAVTLPASLAPSSWPFSVSL